MSKFIEVQTILPKVPSPLAGIEPSDKTIIQSINVEDIILITDMTTLPEIVKTQSDVPQINKTNIAVRGSGEPILCADEYETIMDAINKD